MSINWFLPVFIGYNRFLTDGETEWTEEVKKAPRQLLSGARQWRLIGLKTLLIDLDVGCREMSQRMFGGSLRKGRPMNAGPGLGAPSKTVMASSEFRGSITRRIVLFIQLQSQRLICAGRKIGMPTRTCFISAITRNAVIRGISISAIFGKTCRTRLTETVSIAADQRGRG